MPEYGKAALDQSSKNSNDIKIFSNFNGFAAEKFIKGDGTDETTKVQAALNAAAGNTLFFPYGFSYKITGTVNVPANTRIIAYGAKLYNKDNHFTLLSLNSGVKIYGLEIEGAGNSTYDANGVGVSAKGTFNDTLKVINYVSDILLEECKVHDIGGYGVSVEYGNLFKIRNCSIEKIGYAGVSGLSSKKIHITNKTVIKGISPGRASGVSGETICYNVTFTMRTNGINTATDEIDLVKYPRSTDCSVSDCQIEDNTAWEGMDTHGGENIVFKDNTIRNIKVPIAMVPVEVSITGDSKRYLAPQRCKAIGNTIYGLANARGIVLSGALSNTVNTVDPSTVREYASGCTIEGNILYNCGEVNNDNSGGILIRETSGTNINSNTIDNGNCIGINVFQTNYGFSINGNTVKDVHDATYTTPSCIAIRGTYNQGSINGNNLLRVNGSLDTYVSVRGIWLATGTGNLIALGINAITATTILSVQTAHHSALHYGNIGGSTVRMFSTSGTPENSRSAAAGSLMVNIAGREGDTLFLKETGYSNTGWRGVQTINANATASRPATPPIGYQFYDTTLGKPIWYNGNSVWKDANGTTV